MTSTSPSRVLVLGAGPVGLGAALELARFGIPTTLVEKHDGISWHPKTRNFNTRTMEIARGWGRVVYERLRAIDAPDGWKSPIRFLRSARPAGLDAHRELLLPRRHRASRRDVHVERDRSRRHAAARRVRHVLRLRGVGDAGMPCAARLARRAHAGALDARLVRSGIHAARAGGGAAWSVAAAELADELGVRIDAYTIGAPGLEDDAAFAAAHGLAGDGAVLVRPDGYVGWRRASGPVDVGELRGALRRILAR